MKLPLLSTLCLCLSVSASSFSLQPALSAINTAFELNPYAAGAFVAGFKAGSADIIAQKRQIRMANAEKDDEVAKKEKRGIDIQRALAFLMYGAIYQGLAQEYTYNHLYPVLFGTETTAINVLKKVFCDMAIQTPLLTLPIAYYSKALLVGNSFKQAMAHYVDDVKNRGLLFKFWGLWTPVQCLTFSIIPEHFRVSFIALVSFFWVIILSSLSAAKDAGIETKSSTTETIVKSVNGEGKAPSVVSEN